MTEIAGRTLDYQEHQQRQQQKQVQMHPRSGLSELRQLPPYHHQAQAVHCCRQLATRGLIAHGRVMEAAVD